MKNGQSVKLFFVLFFCTAFIFSFSHFGVEAFGSLAKNGKLAEGTTIGALDVSGKTREQAARLLQEKFVDWLKNESMKLQYGEKEVALDLNQFQLDATGTAASLKDGQRNPAIITIKSEQVVGQIQILLPEIKTSELDLQKLTDSLDQTASLFETGTHSFDLFADYMNASTNSAVPVSQAIVTLKSIPVGLQAAVKQNTAIEIKDSGRFSLLEYAKKHGLFNQDDALNVLATGIYQAILPSNFVIVERNISISLPAYAALGYEASVNASKNADLVFTNPNKTNYRLEWKLVGNQLKVSLIGRKFIYGYKTSLKEKQILQPKTIVQYSPLLLPGKTRIIAKGALGQMVKVYREIYQDNELYKREFISDDYYPPVYQVEVQGFGGGTQQGTEAASGTAGVSTVTNSSGESSSNSNDSQSDPTADSNSSVNDNSDLWGKPDEQTK